MSGVRCFVAIRLEPPLVQALLRACEVLWETDPSWRDEKWVSAENLHVTLKFLGEVNEDDLAELDSRGSEAADEYRRFALPRAGLHPAGGLQRCRMLWSDFLDPEGHCSALHDAIERVALGFGVAADVRAYHPHATLCRARRPRRLSPEALTAAEEVLGTAPDSVSVGSVSLFASRLTPRGPIYREIGAWRLRGE